MGIVYRSWQFWQALLASPSVDELEFVHTILTPQEYNLFVQMHSGEQAHSLKVMHRLIKNNHRDPDLLAAALLHDIGKINQPLNLWERVWLVLGNTFFPGLVSRWLRNSGMDVKSMDKYRRVFVIHRLHPEWGARLAQEAGAKPLCVNLIRRHHDRISPKADTFEDRLLHYLQEADNIS